MQAAGAVGIRNHPNAALALVSGGGGGPLVVWVLNSELHLAVPASGCAAIAGGIAFAVLYVGRRGIRATLRTLWNGPES